MNTTTSQKRLRGVGLLYVLSDFCAVVMACYSAVWMWSVTHASDNVAREGLETAGLGIRNALLQPTRPPTEADSVLAVVLLALTVCSLYALLGLYAGRRSLLPRKGTGTILAANLLALVLCMGALGSRPSAGQAWVTYGAVLQLNVLIALSLRAGLQSGLRAAADRWGIGEHRAVLVGDGRRARALAEIIEQNRPHGLRIVERLPGGDGAIAALHERVPAAGVDTIICADERMGVPEIMEVIDTSAELGTSVKVLSHEMRVLATEAKQPVDSIMGCPLVHFDAPSPRRLGLGLRRALFLPAVLLGTLLLLPVLLALALLVKLTSPGPVLFAQDRIGRNGRSFRMYKFRTMFDGAEQEQERFESQNQADGVLFKIDDDPRITPLGRFLRKFSLDELPQLINVIRGEMEVIGPRPLPRRDYERYRGGWQCSRHAGRQGLTCLWQVSGRCDLDFESMCILDVYYLRNQNPVLDLQILGRTLFAVVEARGAC